MEQIIICCSEVSSKKNRIPLAVGSLNDD